MHNLSRRAFTQETLGSLLTFSLLETLFERDLFADEIKPITIKWLDSVNQLGMDVKDQKIKQVEWQKKIEELFAKVDLPDLLELIDFDRLTKDLQFVDNGARSLSFKFREIEGVPTKLAFGKQIFALKSGRSVVPHGHNNMTTAFLVLRGDFHGRHYDRLQDEKEHFIIKPTIDRKFVAGECSTISDYKDNVHWFQATSDTGFIFNIHVLDVRPGGSEPTGRVYLDPNGEKLKDGLIRAKRLSYKEVNDLYG
ncbi:MAG: hypothetical protein HY000_35465 [Planctomycetes bacterium]|nr:hypothetical protein [Planctomycetota bacterium]